MYNIKRKNKNFINSLNQLALYIILGLLCGLLGAFFSKTIEIATNLRNANTWLIYLLPIGGIILVYLCKILKTEEMSTNSVVKSCSNENCISPLLAPSIFISSAISHLFGASVGREGAALQLGGSLATSLSKVFKVEESTRKTLIYCGMAGVFSSVFGTPVAATFFALQIVSIWRFSIKPLVPCAITSFTSFYCAKILGAHAERFTITAIPKFTFFTTLKVILLALLCGLIAMLFCYCLKFSSSIFKRLVTNNNIRIALGGLITVILTLILNTNDYNGAGLDVINRIFLTESFNREAFILKLIFTCIALSSGFKGGEIVPSLFIGATFGSLISSLIGIPIPFGAAIGMISVFCGVTKCHFATVFLALEMFMGKGIGYMTVAIMIAFLSSGNISLYSAQKFDNIKNFIIPKKITSKTLD